MAINISKTADCNKIIITIPNPTAGFSYEVTVSNGTSDYSYTFAGGAPNMRVFNASVIGGANGLFTISVKKAGTLTEKAAILLACDVLCCIAGKLNELLDCDCDCNKCSSDFVEAQKIFLLLKAAEHEIATASGSLEEVQALIDNANDKYLTAQDMCAGHCGCNC